MDRLTPSDLMMVWPEEKGWAQDIGALAILESDGEFSIESARERVAGRLHRLPHFRQVLAWPRLGLGPPLWVDASAFDISDHVRKVAVDPPGDEAALLVLCEELRAQRLDPGRPLWGMWFITGLPEGRVGLFVKVHHAIADGVSGVAALGALFDFERQTRGGQAARWRPERPPTSSELFDDNVARHLSAARRTVAAVGHPVDAARRAREGWPAVREAFAEQGAPRTSLTERAIGRHRRFALLRTDLPELKAIAHAQGATVNDVLMTVVAGGLRELLLSRGENVAGTVLRAFVPVSLHSGQEEVHGNLDGAMFIPLPIDECDDVRRLRFIAADTRERKKRSRPQGSTLFRNRLIQKAMLAFAGHQHVMNTYVANVPGPPVPMYFDGMPILEVFPIVPLMGNVSVGVGALSYGSQFNLTAVADRDLCADLEVFVDGVRRSVDALRGALSVAASDQSNQRLGDDEDAAYERREAHGDHRAADGDGFPHHETIVPPGAPTGAISRTVAETDKLAACQMATDDRGC